MTNNINNLYRELYSNAEEVRVENKVISSGLLTHRVHFTAAGSESKYDLAIRTSAPNWFISGYWAAVNDERGQTLFYVNKNSAIKRLTQLEGVDRRSLASVLTSLKTGRITITELTSLFPAPPSAVQPSSPARRSAVSPQLSTQPSPTTPAASPTRSPIMEQKTPGPKMTQPVEDPRITRLVDECLDIDQKMAAEVLRQLDERKITISPHSTEEEFNVFKQIVYKAFNQKILENLSTRLKRNVGESRSEFVQAILQDSSYISVDVKANLAILNKNQASQILKKAVALRENYDEILQLRTQISKDLASGKPIDEEHIAKLHRGMPQAVVDNTRALIVQGFIEREKKTVSKYTGSQIESIVLKGLGFNLDNYEDKGAARQKIAYFLDQLGRAKGAQRKTLPQLKQEIENFAFKTRMEAAGIHETFHEHIKELSSVMETIEKGLKAYAIKRLQAGVPEIEQLTTFPKARKFFYNEIEAEIEKRIQSRIEKIVIQSRNEIVKLLDLTSDVIGEQLDLIIKNQLKAKRSTLEQEFNPANYVDEQTDQTIKWYLKYKKTFVGELIQGAEDEQEILGEGVCLAYSHRLNRQFLDNPESSLIEAKADQILSSDRKNQAAYKIALDKENLEMTDIRRHSIAGPKDVHTRPLFACPTDQLEKELKSNLQQLQDSNGACVLGVAGHAMFMRLDTKRGVFMLADPNIGLQVFRIPRKKGQTAEEAIRDPQRIQAAVKRVANCISELIACSYPDTQYIIAQQLVKKEPEKHYPDSFYSIKNF
jgi:hypothetical protein